MNPGVSLLCILVCIIPVGCDRVYVHPFHLFAYKHESCKELEDKERLVKTFVPISIESPITPAYEESVRNKSEEEPQILGVNFLKDSAYVLGARFYSQLVEMHTGENILLSPTSIYQCLLIFYIGASGNTSSHLQSFLGFDPPISQDCTSKIDGHKILPVLRTISSPSEADKLLFSKLFCLFSAPNVHLSESFVHELAFADINFYVRAVDFANPTQAGEQIDAFVKSKNTHTSKSLLTDVDAESNLLFVTYTQFKAIVKGASLLNDPQEFWTDSETKISVPMMRVSGNFEHKFDNNLNLSVIKIPVSESVFLMLLQPINSENLTAAEAQYSFHPSYPWLQKLSQRRINLTLPKLSFESVYNLQDPLNKMRLPELLEKNTNFSKMSDVNLNVRKIINQQLFELRPGEADQAENSTEQNEVTETLSITLNKPFLLAVHEKESSTLLYFGRVINPLQ